MTAKVILNPYSNRWNSQKRWSEAEAALKAEMRVMSDDEIECDQHRKDGAEDYPQPSYRWRSHQPVFAF